jgi:hypothetical protein
MLFVREAYMFCVMSSKPLSRVFFLRKITLPCDQCYHIYTQTFNFNNSQRQCYSFKFTLFKILLNTTCPSRYDHRMLFWIIQLKFQNTLLKSSRFSIMQDRFHIRVLFSNHSTLWQTSQHQYSPLASPIEILGTTINRL